LYASPRIANVDGISFSRLARLKEGLEALRGLIGVEVGLREVDVPLVVEGDLVVVFFSRGFLLVLDGQLEVLGRLAEE
jgi:hypothetical protein